VNASLMKALDQIYNEYHRGLLGFIRRRVDDPSLAEDLLQDVFVKAHSRLDTLANRSRIQAWIYQIARNTIIDHHRTRKIVDPLPEDMAQPSMRSREEYQELSRCVLPMMSLLPEEYRQALILSDLEGLPLKEVAERLNLSLPGAKSRVQRGRERLKRIFLDCCRFEFDVRGKPIDWTPRRKCNRPSC
jgi:RNA polymerase sigma-70 factor, ECF subfamily